MNIYELRGSVDYLAVEYDATIRTLAEESAGGRISTQSHPIALHSLKGSKKKGTPLGDCPYFGPGLLLASAKLRRSIAEVAAGDVDFLPVTIDGKPDYWYMHVACALDALDVERSELKRFPDGAIKYVTQAGFKEDVIGTHRIFKLTNYGGVYVTEELKHHLQAKGVQGVEFRDTAERVENPFTKVLRKG